MRVAFETLTIDPGTTSESLVAAEMVLAASELVDCVVIAQRRFLARCEGALGEGTLLEGIADVPDLDWLPLRPNLLYTQMLNSTRVARRIGAFDAGTIDVVHRLNPFAIRYASACAMGSVPFVWGPLGYSALPKAWASARSQGLSALKRIDRLRSVLPGALLGTTLSRAAMLVAATELARSVLPERVRSKTIVIPHGLRTDLVTFRDPPGHQVPVILYFGRLGEYKGVDCVIDAVSRVPEIPWNLRIAGAGPLEKELRQHVGALGLDHRVTFLGALQRQAVLEEVACADICCLPGVNESFGTVTLEAMAVGRPVVVADWGGPREIVTDECGIRASTASREALVSGIAEALRYLLENPEARARMGAAGRSRAVGVYDIRLLSNRWLEAVYKPVASMKRQTR